VNYDPDIEVIATSGSMQAAYFAMLGLLNPADEVIIPIPTFFFFDVPVELAGATIVFLPLDAKENYVHDANGIESRITK
jgi:aspartate/methionine/tyrosine aminotransferase